MMQAYTDDSGGKGRSRVFVFSSLIAPAEKWAVFSDSWQACLDESPRLRYFKMDEAAGLHGEFRYFEPQERNERVAKFCKIICDCEPTEFAYLVDLEDFEKSWAVTAGRPLSHPYFFAFLMTINGVGYQILSMGSREPFEIFFDEDKIMGPRAKIFYPMIRAIQEEQLIKILPVEPFFRSDVDVLPLQAADITAWIQRVNNDRGLGEYNWLTEHLVKLKRSHLSKVMDANLMKQIQEHKYTPEEIEKNKVLARVYSEIMGFDWPPKDKIQRKRHQGR